MDERGDDGQPESVTLLFTDIAGSTRLLQQFGARYHAVLAEHHRLLRDAIGAGHGTELKTEGDSFFVAFPSAADALRAAVQAQRALAAHGWPDGVRVAVRMGIHSGSIGQVAGEYVGLDIHRAARIESAAHGGQVLVSDTTRRLAADGLPAGVELRDLGEHRLRDIEHPEHLYQLVIPGLPADFPPIRSEAERLDILPMPPSSFVGREEQLHAVTDLLARTRLLTLTGPGGTGKTRLTLEVARRVRARYHDGAVFVPLAAINDPRLVPATIRQVLRLPEEPGRAAIETLIDKVAAKEILLLLDNFEQVLPAAATVARLLAETERVSILVTSRAVLHLGGEQEFPVPPLALPDPTAGQDAESVEGNEAVTLFVQRAREVRPDFGLTRSNAPVVAEICRRLDGLPLALELAASRVKLLPPEALHARLARRLDVLDSRAPERDDRQRTLRGTIEWSHELLDEGLQRLFRRLSIFVGGWTFESAEVVSTGGSEPELDVLDGLSALVDQSLVRQTEQQGEPRFSMLETIREYALERLGSHGERDRVARAHAEHFAALAAQAEPQLVAKDSPWPDRLEREHDNLRAMLRWVLEGGDVELGLTAAGALWRFWHMRGHVREGRRVLTELLALPAAAGSTAGRAKALVGLGGLAYWQGDHAAAREAYEEALAIRRRLGDRRGEAEVIFSMAFLHAIARDVDAARAAFDESRAIYDEVGDRQGSARALQAAGMALSVAGRYAEAVPLLELGGQRMRELGDFFSYSNSRSTLGRAAHRLGDLERARRLHLEGLEASYGMREMTGVGVVLRDLASLAAAEGHYRRAMRLLGAGTALRESLGAEAPRELVNSPDPMPVAREHLSSDEIEDALEEGHRMTVDEAVSYARADAESEH